MLAVEREILADEVLADLQYERNLALWHALLMEVDHAYKGLHIAFDGDQTMSRMELNLIIGLSAKPTANEIRGRWRNWLRSSSANCPLA